jgi:hypothetical protein
MNANEELPENLKGLIEALSVEQAIPMGMISGLPFLAVKIADEEIAKEGALSCELKASILNIDYAEETVGLCFVQLRLNGQDKLIYTATYDLNNAKQYEDCDALLSMKKYGLFIATDEKHDFLAFDTNLKAEFDPRAVLSYAKNESSDYGGELSVEFAYAIRSQAVSARNLWDYLDLLAPYDKEWYGRMQMNKA